MSLLEKSLMLVANKMMRGIGELRELHLNTKARSGSAVVMLAGETEPVAVNVGNYRLERDGHKVILQLRDISCSKEWMDRLAGRLEPQMNIDLPPAFASLARLTRLA